MIPRLELYRPRVIEMSPMRQTLHVLRGTFFDKYRDSKQEDGFHNYSREYAYGISSSFLDLYLLESNEGRVVCRYLTRQGDHVARIHSGIWLTEWSNFAHGMLTGKYPSLLWGLTGPSIDARSIIFQKERYTKYLADQVAPVSYPNNETPWFFATIQDDLRYIGFRDQNLLYYLASRHYIKEDDNSKILEKLAQDDLLKKETLTRAVPLLSFIAEHILLHRPDEFGSFVSDLVDRIGGEEGFEAAYAVCEDLESISPRSPIHDWKEKQSDTLSDTLGSLPEKYAFWRYQNREVVIHPGILERVLHNSSFWEELFLQTGIQDIMKEYFGSEELRPVLETALRERKVIPGLILIFAHILGYDADSAKRLAAVALMGWGVIVSYDNIVDGHMMRKGVRTDVAVFGLPSALDRTMLALARVLQNTLSIDGDRLLADKFLTMLENSCRGDLHARQLNWSDDPFWFIAEMDRIISAFSWFPRFIGQRTSLTEAGASFASFLSSVHTLGQMNNDIEDTEDNLVKHERGKDLGRRITLFWKTLIDLPDEVVTPAEKQLVRSAWQENIQPDIDKILEIGMKYRTAVVRNLYPQLKGIYDQANIMLEQGFQNVPVMDKTNATYRRILLDGLEQEWGKFCRYGEIEEAEPV